ncbi:hypothetical protein HanRHA438_Chr09g0394141 [Helianthus annuus]|uniref:Uncharacterized protein n=1 Tax=Helianthus annuus TaxID=4232 RepID=A0A251TV30_HELAN|nr:hypothetical protein HanXRQr2_Chr09g0382611 [Helianthus annuus]KAJ0525609.1 hypothetical protein HanHA300_Chr09g0313981 [Helianthus annuus]KAJ0533787.1 hypothetical protein HanIR_Chr09g0412391 [Helianthus annuus]KAJ0541992.1 hypothetical protein HanHA89_Chr09g0334851 [Helianthus annuus]KAJ0707057.1 hypothetical protein HanLR1_Chr09g0314201 [Helianthus annuus]
MLCRQIRTQTKDKAFNSLILSLSRFLLHTHIKIKASPSISNTHTSDYIPTPSPLHIHSTTALDPETDRRHHHRPVVARLRDRRERLERRERSTERERSREIERERGADAATHGGRSGAVCCGPRRLDSWWLSTHSADEIWKREIE